MISYYDIINSPGLWPLACQIPDIIQSINHSINSWFLVLGLWCLGLGSYCFFDSPGAHMGVRQGGFHGDVPIAFRCRTTFQLRLKIALVFDTLFLRFWLHLGCQDDPQNPRKSFKNHLRKCTPTSTRFRSDVYRFFLRFSTPWGSKNLAKTL